MFMYSQQILKIIQNLIIVAIMILMIPVAQAKTEIPTYQLTQEKHLIVDYLYRLEKSPQKKAANVISDLTDSDWQRIHLTNGDLLIMPGENWFAFKVKNSSKDAKEIYLEVANQVRMSHSQLYILDKFQQLDQRSLILQRSNTRSVMLTIAPHSQLILYLSIESATQLRSSAMIYSAKSYVEASSKLQFQQGIAIGGIFCLSLSLML